MKNNLLVVAIKMACDAHSGQVDKGNQPYILHSLAVMARVDSIEEKMVAVLHDVLEDSTLFTTKDMLEAGIPGTVIEALHCITKRKEESYWDYLNRVKSNPIATKVKIADLTENSNLDRIPNPTSKDRQRLEKYKSALEFLQS